MSNGIIGAGSCTERRRPGFATMSQSAWICISCMEMQVGGTGERLSQCSRCCEVRRNHAGLGYGMFGSSGSWHSVSVTGSCFRLCGGVAKTKNLFQQFCFHEVYAVAKMFIHRPGLTESLRACVDILACRILEYFWSPGAVPFLDSVLGTSCDNAVGTNTQCQVHFFTFGVCVCVRQRCLPRT